jgi:hypothetical protein
VVCATPTARRWPSPRTGVWRRHVAGDARQRASSRVPTSRSTRGAGHCRRLFGGAAS